MGLCKKGACQVWQAADINIVTTLSDHVNAEKLTKVNQKLSEVKLAACRWQRLSDW
jgi:hypothetical protein